jgi:hypothetical protein
VTIVSATGRTTTYSNGITTTYNAYSLDRLNPRFRTNVQHFALKPYKGIFPPQEELVHSYTPKSDGSVRTVLREKGILGLLKAVVLGHKGVEIIPAERVKSGDTKLGEVLLRAYKEFKVSKTK